jgi:hypothetical protein
VANLDESDPSVTFPIDQQVDVVFILSLGSWLKKWKEVYHYALEHATTLFLETNNDEEGAAQLAFFAEYDVIMISAESKDDCTGNHRRKLYKITRKN